jgi:hypothetical protein
VAQLESGAVGDSLVHGAACCDHGPILLVLGGPVVGRPGGVCVSG